MSTEMRVILYLEMPVSVEKALQVQVRQSHRQIHDTTSCQTFIFLDDAEIFSLYIVSGNQHQGNGTSVCISLPDTLRNASGMKIFDNGCTVNLPSMLIRFEEIINRKLC